VGRLREPDRRARREGRQRAERADVCLLEDVVDRVTVAEQPERERPEAGIVVADQVGEGMLVARPGAREHGS